MACNSGLFQPRRQDLGAHDLRYASSPWVHLPGHTLAYWDGQLRPELGSARHKRLVLLEGDTLAEYATDGVYTDALEIETDRATGIEYHRTLVMTIDTRTVKGRLTMRPTGNLGRWFFPPGSGYVRYVCDGEASLEILGRKVDATIPMINELTFLKTREEPPSGR